MLRCNLTTTLWLFCLLLFILQLDGANSSYLSSKHTSTSLQEGIDAQQQQEAESQTPSASFVEITDHASVDSHRKSNMERTQATQQLQQHQRQKRRQQGHLQHESQHHSQHHTQNTHSHSLSHSESRTGLNAAAAAISALTDQVSAAKSLLKATTKSNLEARTKGILDEDKSYLFTDYSDDTVKLYPQTPGANTVFTAGDITDTTAANAADTVLPDSDDALDVDKTQI